MLVVWVLSIQLWTENPPSIRVLYTKEYSTYAECMQARATWIHTPLQVLCLNKSKK